LGFENNNFEDLLKMKRAVLNILLLLTLKVTLISEQFPSLKDAKVNSNLQGFIWVNPGKYQMGSG
jgi:hypothetical protein